MEHLLQVLCILRFSVPQRINLSDPPSSTSLLSLSKKLGLFSDSWPAYHTTRLLKFAILLIATTMVRLLAPAALVAFLYGHAVTGRKCQDIVVPVSISARNGVFDLAAPGNNIDLTNFILDLAQLGANYSQAVLGGVSVPFTSRIVECHSTD